MKRVRDKLDPKYMKVSAYACLTVLITAVALMLLYLTGGIWATLWAVLIEVFKPVILGVFLCNLLSPIVNWFEKLFNKNGEKSWAKIVAVILTYVLILVVIIIMILLIIITVYKSFSAVNMDNIKGLFSSITGDVTDFKQLINNLTKESGLSLDKITGLIGPLAGGLAGLFSLLMFGIIFSIYFLLDGNRIGGYLRRVFRVFAGEKNDEQLTRFLDDTNQVFSGYIRGKLVDALVVAVLTSAALLIAGVPCAIVVGLLSGLGCLIPFGSIILGCLATALVCIPGGQWKELIIGIILVLVIMFVDGNVIGPRLLSNSIETHALLVVAAMLGGGVVGGILGMIVAIPIATLLKMQLDRYLKKKESEKAADQ